MSITTIEWTKRPGTVGETWNPTTGCNKVDRGCKNCYAEVMHSRLRAMGQKKYKWEFLKGAVAHPDTLVIPDRWRTPRTVFVNSMSDLFHELLPFEFIHRVFLTMELNPKHTFLVLTKRPEVAVEFAKFWTGEPGHLKAFPPNVWIGTSVHNQESADKRIPLVLQLPATVIFVSYEPAIGPVNFKTIGTYHDRIDALTGVKFVPGSFAAEHRNHRRLDWVIMGGESGPKAQPMHPDWVRQVRDDCFRAAVPFFFKQWGTWEPFDVKVPNMEEVGKVFTFTERKGKTEFVWGDPYRFQWMRRTKEKNHHELDGKVWQQFPTPKT